MKRLTYLALLLNISVISASCAPSCSNVPERDIIANITFTSRIPPTTKTFSIQDYNFSQKATFHGLTYRSWEDEIALWRVANSQYPQQWGTPPSKPISFEEFLPELRQFIVLHYTANLSVQKTSETFSHSGTSAHYVIANDGTDYQFVDPAKNVAYHAGFSYWAGKINMNYYSIGIEHINPGWRDTPQNISDFGTPIQYTGSDNYWYPFSNAQFEASMALIQYLQKTYRIPSYNIVTHADIAIERKVDLGPAWNYRRAAEEFGVGFFPTETHQTLDFDFSKLTDVDFHSLITCFGYAPVKYYTSTNPDTSPKYTIAAYQMHYSTSNISGELTLQTKADIIKHIIALWNHYDEITGQKFEFFQQKLVSWAKENPQKAQLFSEFINI